MAITAAQSSNRWGLESTFNTAVTPSQTFGWDAEITGLMLDNSALPLRDLGSRLIGEYAFGANKAGYSLSSVLSNSWLLRTVFAKDETAKATAGTGNAQVYTYRWETDPNIKSFTSGFRLDGPTGDVALNLVGCLVTRWNISSQVEQYVRQSIDVTSGKVTVANTAYAAYAAVTNEPTFPFTFRYGTVRIGTSVLSEVQNFDISVDTGQTMRYTHGSLDSVAGIAGAVDITGNITYSLGDNSAFELVNNRGTTSTIELDFDNGVTGSDLRGKSSMKFILSGVVFPKVSIDVKKVDPIDNNLSFQARKCVVEIKHRHDAIGNA